MRTEPHGTTQEHRPSTSAINTNLDWELRHEKLRTISKLGRQLAPSMSKDEPRHHQEHEARRNTWESLDYAEQQRRYSFTRGKQMAALRHQRYRRRPPKNTTKQPPSTPNGRTTTTTTISAANNTHTHTHNNHANPKMMPSRRATTLVASPSSVPGEPGLGVSLGEPTKRVKQHDNDVSKKISGAHRCRHRRLQMEQGFHHS